jgi:hypothetical protein
VDVQKAKQGTHLLRAGSKLRSLTAQLGLFPFFFKDLEGLFLFGSKKGFG